MFIADCDCDEVKREASKLLKSFDIKHRYKKTELKNNDKRDSDGVFKIRLEKLRQKKVKLLQYDRPVTVPAFLVDSCEYLRDRLDTEGLFRKPGVMLRQRELKKMLVSGGRLAAECDHNPADVADLLKLFFRELPEPCIPFAFHDILQRCMEIKEKRMDATFITLLLLPNEYLYTVAYLMQFLQEVATHCQKNRMDTNNLAIVWTPNLMPFKNGQAGDKQALDKRLTVVQLLIEHSKLIGVVPECLSEHLSWLPSTSISSHDDLECCRYKEKKKKRRSSSLTRMLSGIRKIVQRSGSEENVPEQVTPENTYAVAHTPRIMSTGTKRKASESNLPSFSAKKRKNLLEMMPQGHLLPDVCTNSHLTPRILVAQPSVASTTVSKMSDQDAVPKGRSRFYTSNNIPEREGKQKSQRSVSSSRLRLSHFGIGRKDKKKAQVAEEFGKELSMTPETLDITTSPIDYVRIPRTEYEEIKNRMSMIESRISSEFENIVGVSMSDLEMSPEPPVKGRLQTVQFAYERTLESAEKLNSPSSDELARRFSKELKIRSSSEERVIRSPSARKIGSLRRRSKENAPQVKRNLSLNTGDRCYQFYPNNSLRRGKPNTVSSGLPEPLTLDSTKSYLKNLTDQLKLEAFDSPRDDEKEKTVFETFKLDLNNFGVLTRSQARRASSFHGFNVKVMTPPSNGKNIKKSPNTTEMEWKNANEFLDEEKVEDKSVTGRPSVQRLRSQNAGMVLAKAKLFSTMVTQDESSKTVNRREMKSRDLKKRNSSKSSKERRPHRKDSTNSNRRMKQSSSSSTSRENLPMVSQRRNNHNNCAKENVTKNSDRAVKSSVIKTTIECSNIVPKGLKDNCGGKIVSGRYLNRVISPLRDRNGCYSPADSQHPFTGRTPKLISAVKTDGRKTPRTTHCTPRRSPRKMLLKNQHLSKQCS